MRSDLGKYETGAQGLTLHDLSELIRRAGHTAGFSVQSEYPAGRGVRNSRKIDWVWLRAGEPVVAFEIEGLNVAPQSLQMDCEKFATLPRSCHKVLALYSVQNNHLPKRNPPCGLEPKTWVYNKWPSGYSMEGTVVLTDTELLSHGGIEGLQDVANSQRTAVNP